MKKELIQYHRLVEKKRYFQSLQKKKEEALQIERCVSFQVDVKRRRTEPAGSIEPQRERDCDCDKCRKTTAGASPSGRISEEDHAWINEDASKGDGSSEPLVGSRTGDAFS